MAQFPPVTAEVDPTVNAKIAAAVAAITPASIGAATPSQVSAAVAAVTPASLGVPTTTDLANAVAPLASAASVTAAIATAVAPLATSDSVTAAVAAINAGTLGVPTLTPFASQAIVAQDPAITPLIVQAASGQTADIATFKNSAGSSVAAILNNGAVYSPSGVNANAYKTTGSVTKMVLNDTNTGVRITSGSASDVILNVKGVASQAADIMQVQNSAAAVVSSFSSGGGFYTASWIRSGISLSGAQVQAQTGSASTIGLVLRGSASQSANMLAIQDSAGSLQSGIDAFGNAMFNSYKTTGSLVRMNFGANGATSGSVNFPAGGSANIGVTIDGGTVQTGDLLRFRDVSANVLGRVAADGTQQITSTSTTVTPLLVKLPASFAGNFIDLQDSASSSKFSVNQSGTVQAVNLLASAALRGVTIQNSSGANVIGLQIGTTKVLMSANAVADNPLAVRGVASQTGDLFRAESTGGTGVFVVQASGYVQAAQGATVNNSLRLGGASGVQADAGSGLGVLAMANATTTPTTTPAGGGVLYVTGGALRFRGSAGTDTLIAAA